MNTTNQVILTILNILMLILGIVVISVFLSTKVIEKENGILVTKTDTQQNKITTMKTIGLAITIPTATLCCLYVLSGAYSYIMRNSVVFDFIFRTRIIFLFSFILMIFGSRMIDIDNTVYNSVDTMLNIEVKINKYLEMGIILISISCIMLGMLISKILMENNVPALFDD